MKGVQTWLEDEQNHIGKSMLILAVIAPGDNAQWLYTVDGVQGWHVPTLVHSLRNIKSLSGKPKVLFLQAFKAGKYMIKSN